VSAIHTKTIIESLDRYPKTLEQLSEETQYSQPLLMRYLIEARIDGHKMVCERIPGGSSEWSHQEGCCEQ